MLPLTPSDKPGSGTAAGGVTASTSLALEAKPRGRVWESQGLRKPPLRDRTLHEFEESERPRGCVTGNIEDEKVCVGGREV